MLLVADPCSLTVIRNRALASGLAAAVDAFAWALRQEDPPEGEGDRRRLSDLLFHALLLLARRLAHTRLAVQAHGLAASLGSGRRDVSSSLARPPGLALPDRAALEAQVLLELLARAWSTGNNSPSSPSSSSRLTAAAAAAAALSRNARFTPAALLALAMGEGTGGGPTNPGVAALILEAAGRPEAALELRLGEAAMLATKGGAAAASPENLEAEVMALLLGLVRSHVLCRGGGNGGSVDWSARRRMATRVLESWARLRLPPAPLEAFVLGEEGDGSCGWERHVLKALLVELLVLHAGGCPFLSWKEEEEKRGEGGTRHWICARTRPLTYTSALAHSLSHPALPFSPTQPTTGEPGSPVDAQGAVLGQLRFSSQLYVRLCQHVVDHGREMQLEGITDLWSTGGRPSGLVGTGGGLGEFVGHDLRFC